MYHSIDQTGNPHAGAPTSIGLVKNQVEVKPVSVHAYKPRLQESVVNP